MQITARLTDTVTLGLRKLGVMIPEITYEEVISGLEQAVKEARGGWPGGSYSGYVVPPPFRSGYVRTTYLGRATYWIQEGKSYRLKSETPYAKYVIGDGTGGSQASIHRNRWPLAYDVMRKWVDTMVENMRNRIRRSAEAIGL